MNINNINTPKSLQNHNHNIKSYNNNNNINLKPDMIRHTNLSNF